MLALALLALALPPLPPFPSELRPRDGTTAPQNASLYALGDPAPSLDQIGAAATVDGAPASLGDPVAVGCCVVVIPFAAPPAAGAAVSVTVTSAAGESTSTWTAGPPDHTPPALAQDPVVIDHHAVAVGGDPAGGEDMIVGLEVSDDTQVGMITASLADGTVVGATVDGYTLRANAPVVDGQACVDVTVTDVAGNASAATPVCVAAEPAEGEGEGEGDVDGAECEGPGDVPVHVPSTSAVLALLVVLGLGPRRAR